MNTDQIQKEAEAKWGFFRKFIAKNPLTGFWIGVSAPILIGGIIRTLVPGI